MGAGIMSNAPGTKKRTVEIDPRFPSGPWTGFWIQTGFGKQQMSLSLAFFDGCVRGCGRDIVGRFNFDGVYDLKSGRVQIAKQYEGAHLVGYEGANQADGLWVWGIWNIRSVLRGGFHIWPEWENDPTQGRLSAEKELQKPRRLKRGELVGGLAP